jgi:YaiO family outer membrane protein
MDTGKMKNSVTESSFAPRVLLLFGALALPCAAQVAPQVQTPATNSSQPAPEPAATEGSPKLLTNYVESGADYLQLSNNYGSWAGGYARGVYEHGKDVWNGEVNGQREFGDKGVYLAAGDTHTFSPNWYAALTVGSSVQGFFWPRFRTDAFLNRKLLSRQQLVATIGYGYYAAKDVHRNQDVYLGSTYYFVKPWVVEEGLYLGVSNPGTVFAPSGFVAVTEGENKRHYVTLRVGLGEEGYQLVGPTSTLTKFESQEVTGTWRQWLGTNWGFDVVGDYYHNPYYARGGPTLGLFKEF